MPYQQTILGDFIQPAAGSTHANDWGFVNGVLNANSSTSFFPNSITPNSTITSSTLTQGQEAAEVTHAIIFPPLAADGKPENMDVTFVADGNPIESIRLSAYRPTLMAPLARWIHVDGRLAALVKFGDPIFQAVRKGSLFDAAAIKYTRQIIPVFKAIDGNVTGAGSQARCILVGYRYNADELPEVTAGIEALANVNMTDHYRIKHGLPPLMFTYKFSGNPHSLDGWSKLPGGTFQGVDKVFRHMKWGRNRSATTPNTSYTLTLSTDIPGGNPNNVLDTDHDLGYPFVTQHKALIVTGVGVKNLVTDGSQNARMFWLKRGNETTPDQDKFLIDGPMIEQFNFGQSISNPSEYDVIPAYPGERPVVFAENAAWTFQDNGTPVPANAFVLAVTGYEIDFVQG